MLPRMGNGMSDLFLLGIGAFLTVFGFFSLLLKLWRINAVQGLVADAHSPIFAFWFGLFNWRRTWGYLVAIGVGILMCAVALFT